MPVINMAQLRAIHQRQLSRLGLAIQRELEEAAADVAQQTASRWPYYRKALKTRVSVLVSFKRLRIRAGKTRRHVIVARRAKALRFRAGGRLIFRKRVNHPGSVPRKPAERMYARAIERLNATLPAAIRRAAKGL